MMKSIVVLVLVLGTYLPILAQDSLRLSFDKAVEIALEQNLNHQINLNQQSVVQAQKKQAFFANFPSVSASTNVSSSTGQQFQQVEGELIVQNITNNVVSSGLNVNAPIFNAFRRIHTYQASRFRLDAGEENVNRSEQNVIFEVGTRYLQVLLDQELLNIAQENLINQQEQLRQIEGFVENGLRTLSDQYNQQSEVARLEAVKVDAEMQLENDQLLLAETLQLMPGQIPIVEEIQAEFVENEWLNLSIDELVSQAMQFRSDLKSQRFAEEAFRMDLKASKSIYYPQLSAYFNYNTFFTSLDDRSFNEQFLNIYPQRALGLRLSIPIFSNFENKLRVSQSKVAVINEELRSADLERKIYQDVRLAYQNYKASIAKMKSNELQLAAATEAQKAISERFRLGVSNFVDLAQANRQLAQAQADYAQATYTLYFQDVMLKYALGTLNF
ncbi:TolC family protein [Fulvivirgaceae bacterium LMO-SS25]